MVELAGVEPGSRVLDVAAGYGEPSLTAAAVAGAEGKVVSTDISAEMLAYGRERAAAAGLENVEFVESETASLEFPLESFDAALSRFGIIFEPEAGGLLEGGGFSDVEVEETEVSFTWESADEFVAMVKDTVPPLVALIAKHAPDDPDRAWDAIVGAVKDTASDDGTVTFSNLVLLAVGRA
jgi:SAM-dependent methyltransferase